METEAVIEAPTAIAAEPVTEPELYLIARNPDELNSAHGNMRKWAQSMVTNMQAEVAECQAAYDVAMKNKWASGRLKRLLAVAKQRTLFYEKIDTALASGYLVVPNFQMDTFMIRTAKKKPNRAYEENRRWTEDARLAEESERLPQGEGENRNPIPKVNTSLVEATKDSRGNSVEIYRHEATEWNQVGFPIALAKSAIMADGAKAAALKLFDEIGIAQDAGNWGMQRRKGDPMLLGRLLNPRANRPAVTFFIAWAIDLRAI